MGNKQTTKRVVYLDNSKRIEAEAKHKTKLQLENERQLKEAELVKRKDRHNDLFCEAALQRRAILDYKFGEKHGLGSFSSLDVADFTHPKSKLRIALIGPAGAGKSSFINTCERTIKITNKGSCEVYSGGEGTIRLQDYLGGICAFSLVDIRGFQQVSKETFATIRDVLDGNIRPGEIVDFEKCKTGAVSKLEEPLVNRIHGVICCTNPMDPYLRNGTLKEALLEFRDILKERGIVPVIVITHKDRIATEEERKKIVDLVSASTTSAKNTVFFIRNYTPDHNERDPNIELDVFRILHFSLVAAERFVKIATQRMTSQTPLSRQSSNLSVSSATFSFDKSLPRPSSVARAPAYQNVRVSRNSVSDCPIQILFAQIIENNRDLPEADMMKLQSDLLRLGVRTLAAFVKVWDKVRSQMVKNEQIRTCIDQELEKRLTGASVITIL